MGQEEEVGEGSVPVAGGQGDEMMGSSYPVFSTDGGIQLFAFMCASRWGEGKHLASSEKSLSSFTESLPGANSTHSFSNLFFQLFAKQKQTHTRRDRH